VITLILWLHSENNMCSVLWTGWLTFLDRLTVDSMAGSETTYSVWNVLCIGWPTFLDQLTVDSVAALWYYRMWSVLCTDALPSWTSLQLTLWLHSETIVCEVNCQPRKTFPYSLYPQEYIHILSSACSCCGYWLKAFVTFCAVNGQFFLNLLNFRDVWVFLGSDN